MLPSSRVECVRIVLPTPTTAPNVVMYIKGVCRSWLPHALPHSVHTRYGRAGGVEGGGGVGGVVLRGGDARRVEGGGSGWRVGAPRSQPTHDAAPGTEVPDTSPAPRCRCSLGPCTEVPVQDGAEQGPAPSVQGAELGASAPHLGACTVPRTAVAGRPSV